MNHQQGEGLLFQYNSTLGNSTFQIGLSSKYYIGNVK